MFNLLDFLLDGEGKFYPFERRILEEVICRLGTQNGLLLQRQIDIINKIQRLRGGKEVNLYQMRYGKAVFDDNLRFPNAPDEVLLACVNLRLPNDPMKLKVKVWMVQGRLFSLEYNKPPNQFFAGISLKDAQPEIVKVECTTTLCN
jgi:hypothetical protein